MDRALGDTCNNRRHMGQPSPGPPAEHRSTGQDTASGHCTVSDRRTAFDRRTACDRRTVSCHRMVSGPRTAAGPEVGRGEDSARPTEEDSHSGWKGLEANSSGRVDISDLMNSPGPGTVVPVDRPGPGPEAAGMALRAGACRLQPPVVNASDLHSQREADSANLPGCLAGGPLSLSDIRLTFLGGFLDDARDNVRKEFV